MIILTASCTLKPDKSDDNKNKEGDKIWIPMRKSDQSESLYEAVPTEDNQEIIYCYQNANALYYMFCNRPSKFWYLYHRSYIE